MKKILLICIAMGFAVSLSAQKVALKNNLLYDATLTPNLALEIGLAPKMTLDLGVGYNPFTYSDNKKIKHWLVQPEFRYWFCERFNGSFLGLHFIGGEFNVGNIKLPFGIYPGVDDYRYEGWAIGGGISYGYQWILGKRWNLEANLGVGYARANYDQYECASCGSLLGSDTKNYFGITRAGISLAYFLW
jgi:hypothetical protein